MTQFLTYLYAIVPAFVIIGWIPQLVALFRDLHSARGMSVGTWAILANFIGQATILGFAIWAKTSTPDAHSPDTSSRATP